MLIEEIEYSYRTDRGGVNDILLLNGLPLCAPGVTLTLVLGSPCLLPGKDISQCQRLAKREGIIYSKSYTDLE